MPIIEYDDDKYLAAAQTMQDKAQELRDMGISRTDVEDLIDDALTVWDQDNADIDGDDEEEDD